jgi:hypothetical protein
MGVAINETDINVRQVGECILAFFYSFITQPGIESGRELLLNL